MTNNETNFEKKQYIILFDKINCIRKTAKKMKDHNELSLYLKEKLLSITCTLITWLDILAKQRPFNEYLVDIIGQHLEKTSQNILQLVIYVNGKVNQIDKKSYIHSKLDNHLIKLELMLLDH